MAATETAVKPVDLFRLKTFAIPGLCLPRCGYLAHGVSWDLADKAVRSIASVLHQPRPKCADAHAWDTSRSFLYPTDSQSPSTEAK